MMPLAYAVLYNKLLCLPLPDLIALMQHKSIVIVVTEAECATVIYGIAMFMLLLIMGIFVSAYSVGCFYSCQ